MAIALACNNNGNNSYNNDIVNNNSDNIAFQLMMS